MLDKDGAEYVAQIDPPQKIARSEHAIRSTLGKACRDFRIHHDDPVGPYVEEEALSQVLRNADEPSRRGYEICLTRMRT